MIEEVMGKLKLRSTLHYSTFQEVTKAKIVWASKLEFFYPFPMSVVGHGVTKCSAETAAAALAFVKLKVCQKAVIHVDNALIFILKFILIA